MGCIICGHPEGNSEPANFQHHFNCPRCGTTCSITFDALNKIKSPEHQRILSCECRKKSGTDAVITSEIVTALQAYRLPTLKEQADILITFYGISATGNPKYRLDYSEDKSIIFHLAALLMLPLEHDVENMEGYIEQILRVCNVNEAGAGYFEGQQNSRRTMTFKGWERYHELTSEKFDEKKQAFFALKFPDCPDKAGNEKYSSMSEISTLYNAVSNRSIEELGIHIYNPLLGEPKGGLIHSRMEVEIRKSLFLVADLSHENQGAYWEAGFAHGLGLPVFYLCHTSKKDDVHFDTRSHFRIEWDSNTIDNAVNDLFNAIRATLPGRVR